MVIQATLDNGAGALSCPQVPMAASVPINSVNMQELACLASAIGKDEGSSQVDEVLEIWGQGVQDEERVGLRSNSTNARSRLR